MRSPVICKKYDVNWRDCIWSTIRQCREFSRRDIERRVAATPRAVTDYVNGLTRIGYVQQLGPDRWTLVKDVGVEAPKLKSNGRAVDEHRFREQLWRTINILKEFNLDELMTHASTENYPVRATFAKHYVNTLQNAGYLARITRGSHAQRARYRLLASRYSGPKPPIIKYLMQVLDANTGKIVWQAGSEEVPHEQ